MKQNRTENKRPATKTTKKSLRHNRTQVSSTNKTLMMFFQQFECNEVYAEIRECIT